MRHAHDTTGLPSLITGGRWARAMTVTAVSACLVACSNAGADEPTESTAGATATSQVAAATVTPPGATAGATGSPSTEGSSSTTASGTDGQQAAPSAPAETAGTAAGATTTDEEVAASPDEDTDAQEPRPTLQERPAADLSDEEIAETYADDVAPGEEVTATLCNLTREHLELVESRISGPEGVDAQNLRLALLSLGDDLSVWEGITWHLPEAAGDIETARTVYAYWDYALALVDAGDAAAAQDQLEEAARTIDELPADPDVQLGCDG